MKKINLIKNKWMSLKDQKPPSNTKLMVRTFLNDLVSGYFIDSTFIPIPIWEDNVYWSLCVDSTEITIIEWILNDPPAGLTGKAMIGTCRIVDGIIFDLDEKNLGLDELKNGFLLKAKKILEENNEELQIFLDLLSGINNEKTNN